MRSRLLTLPVLAVLVSTQGAPELVISVGHAGAPSYAVFAGGYLATASWSNVALIDLSSGLAISHLPQGSLVDALESSPAGDLLAVGTCDHSIRLWDVRARTVRSRIGLSQECAETLSFSPDGAFLATGAYGCCSTATGLQVWDVRTGKLARELAKGSGIREVVFSGNGRWLAGIDDKGKASVFEWPSGRPLRSYDGLEGAGVDEYGALASLDGRYLAWLGRRGLQVWDMTTGAAVALPGVRTVIVQDFSPGRPERERTEQQVTASAAEFLNDGRLAYVDDDHVFIATLPAGAVQELSLTAPPVKVFGDVVIPQFLKWLRIRRDGLMLAGANESRTLLWDVAAARVRELTAPALDDPSSLQWSRSGVIAWGDWASGVRAWDDRSGELVNLAREIDSASTLAFDTSGSLLAVSDSSSMRVVDVRTRRVVTSVELPTTLRSGVTFSPDGSRLAFETSEGLAIVDASLRRHAVVSALEEHTNAEYVAFSPDGRWIAAGLGGPRTAVRVWPSARSGSAVTLDSNRLTYGPQPPAFSSDSRWLATFSRGQNLMVWATASWAVERTWSLPGTGRALAFAPDGSRLAIAADGEAAIWDAATGRRLVTFSSSGSSQSTEIAWSPDGRRVATSADDGVLRFWDPSDGRLLASLFTLQSSDDWLLVTPDGRLDGSARALSSIVAWREGDRVARDMELTGRRRVPHLWRLVASPTRKPALHDHPPAPAALSLR